EEWERKSFAEERAIQRVAATTAAATNDRIDALFKAHNEMVVSYSQTVDFLTNKVDIEDLPRLHRAVARIIKGIHKRDSKQNELLLEVQTEPLTPSLDLPRRFASRSMRCVPAMSKS